MRIRFMTLFAIVAAATVCITVIVGLANADAAKGKLGDPAPALQVGKWVKGQAVNLADGKGKTIYVVEFWATWCPPCRESVPHLTQLQKNYKDKNVVVIGVASDDEEAVKPFVEKQGADMDYAVAVDTDDLKTTRRYFDPYGVETLPHAFIVDKEGKIAWHGNPLDGVDKPLDKILAKKTQTEKNS